MVKTNEAPRSSAKKKKKLRPKPPSEYTFLEAQLRQAQQAYDELLVSNTNLREELQQTKEELAIARLATTMACHRADTLIRTLDRVVGKFEDTLA